MLDEKEQKMQRKNKVDAKRKQNGSGVVAKRMRNRKEQKGKMGPTEQSSKAYGTAK